MAFVVRVLSLGGLVLVALLSSAAVAPDVGANHEHPGAPCWSNGYGDGTDNNRVAHPYVHYAGDASCGYNSLSTNQRVSLDYHPGPAGTAGWDQVFYQHCGFGYHCDATLQLGRPDCDYRAGVIALSAVGDHKHGHHYPCTSL